MARAPGTRDFRDGTTRNPESKDPPKKGRTDNRLGDQASRRWWEKTGKECAESITSVVQFLQQAQAPRLRNMVMNARLYGNMGTLGIGSSSFGTLLQSPAQAKKFATYNACQSGIDTLVSHIGESKPRPYYLTSGGNYKQQRQAKKRTQFIDGVFYETKTYRKGSECFRDAAIWGDGFMHAFVRGGKIQHERVIGAELWVDETEAQYGNPRNLSRVKAVDRDELAGYFPEFRADIMKADRAKETQASASQNISDMVTVAECWHLGSLTPKGEMVGGKVAIALVSGGVMLQEPEDWEHDFFPFARLPWCKPVVGYWAQGGAEQVRGEQMWLNELFATVQKAMRLAGTIKVAMSTSSKIVDEHVNNEIGAIIKYAGTQTPTFFTSAPVDPSFFMEMREGIERIYKKLGVSELSAANMKPAGLDSKPSLREYKETQNERHKSTAEAYDDFFLQLASIDLALAGGLKGYSVRVPGNTGFTSISAADLRGFKDEDFIQQCFPVSQLPRDPAGRTQTVQEWVQAGWLTPRQGRKLMDFPDLQASNTLADAQEELVLQVLDAIVDEGEYAPPEPTDDLALNKETVLHYIQLYRRLDLEPEKMDMLRSWNSQVDMLMARALAPIAAAPPAMPGAPATGVPQAQPMPAPQSQLLPQA